MSETRITLVPADAERGPLAYRLEREPLPEGCERIAIEAYAPGRALAGWIFGRQRPGEPQVAEIEDLWVARAWRRHRVAWSLADAFGKAARAAGCDRLVAYTDPRDPGFDVNIATIRAYGFVARGVEQGTLRVAFERGAD